MKKIILGIVAVALVITGYVTYDYLQVSSFRNDLVDQINRTNVSFIEENENKIEKYRNVGSSYDHLKQHYDLKYNNNEWSLALKLDKSSEYVMLFGELPKINDQVIDVYFKDYILNHLNGTELVNLELIELNDVDNLVNQISKLSSKEVYQSYYKLVMANYLDGSMNMELTIAFHDSLRTAIADLKIKPSELFSTQIPELMIQYETYDQAKTATRNIESLSKYAASSSSLVGLYNGTKEVLRLIDVFEDVSYNIDNLEFTSSPDARTFIIQEELVRSIRDLDLEEDMAIKQLTDQITHEDVVRNMTLEKNKIYYIITINDYFRIQQIEIVYTFDDDYSQFVHVNDSEDILANKHGRLNFEYNYNEDLNIEYLKDASDSEVASYKKVISDILPYYDKVILPIIVADHLNHYFKIKDGKYYTDLDSIFSTNYSSSKYRKSVSFFVVDELGTDLLQASGIATPLGILLDQDIINDTKEFRKTLHHELIHAIDLHYRKWHNIHYSFKKGDFVYLSERGLSIEELRRNLYFENFSSTSSLRKFDDGMTSYYSGWNKEEHLAELWSDFVTDYELYSSLINDYPVLVQNTEVLLTYINKVLDVVNSDEIDDLKALQQFNGYQKDQNTAYRSLTSNISKGDFTGSVMIELPEEDKIKYDRLLHNFRLSKAEYEDWYIEYYFEQQDKPLPYHENFGISKDEYEYILEMDESKSLTELSITQGTFKEIEPGRLQLVCEDLTYLNGLIFDLDKNIISAPYGDFYFDNQFDVSINQTITGPFTGGSWVHEVEGYQYKKSIEKDKLYGYYKIFIGHLEESNELLIKFYQYTYMNGVFNIDTEYLKFH